jgi:hypothetical protein
MTSVCCVTTLYAISATQSSGCGVAVTAFSMLVFPTCGRSFLCAAYMPGPFGPAPWLSGATYTSCCADSRRHLTARISVTSSNTPTKKGTEHEFVVFMIYLCIIHMPSIVTPAKCDSADNHHHHPQTAGLWDLRYRHGVVPVPSPRPPPPLKCDGPAVQHI